MEFLQYVEGAARTMPESMRWDDLLADAALGLCGEAEEVLETLEAKEAEVEESLDDEIGDAWWYVAAAYRSMAMQMEIEPPDRWRAADDTNASELLRLAARFAERVKKVRYHGEPLSDHAEALLEALGRFGGLLSEMTSTPTAEVWRANVEKLAERYPDGFEPSGR